LPLTSWQISLSEDFDQLHKEATAWVEENGGDKGHGWLIQSPLKKIKRYQLARIDNGGPLSSSMKMKEKDEDVETGNDGGTPPFFFY